MVQELERNKELVRHWLEFADSGFTGKFEDFLTADYIGHLPDRAAFGLDELKSLERRFAAAFSGVHRSIDDLIAEHDKVVLRVTTTGTHTGEFNRIAPTGRQIQFVGMVVYRIQDGRIAEAWGQLDADGLWRQLTLATV
jgi:predicted ester cyclase